MSVMQIVFGVVLIVFSLAIVGVVLLQEAPQQNIGVFSGQSDTFLSKNRSRSLDAFLARWTKFISIGFFVAVILIDLLMK